MEWNLDKSRPLCPQISEQLCLRIAIGEFQPGERLLSVRDVALAAGVNPNTVQRSFEMLEQQGLVYSLRGSGWYVSANIAPAKAALARLWEEKTAAYFASMALLGKDTDAVKSYVAAFSPEREEEHE